MTRAVVFKTKGKLDLRSITVFGLNAKPETTTPIGYFGTGLKYAIAVLAREHIPITIWIDGKKWTIEAERTFFRDRGFESLYLKNDRKLTFSRTLALPFTTELGKNWELWQAFRELESNTRDEKGITYIKTPKDTYDWVNKVPGPYTYIVVESEAFVQEYFDRDKTFLPEGLTESNSSERVQCFPRKSKSIFYRSIRILDLEEPSENTYNILVPIRLTEDRTASSEFDVRWEIQNYIAKHAPKTISHRAIVAPAKTYESRFDYSYASKTDCFLDTIQEAGENATRYAKEALKIERPPEPPKKSDDWILDLISAIDDSRWNDVQTIINDGHSIKLVQILTKAAQEKKNERREQEATDNWLSRGTKPEDQAAGRSSAEGSITGRIIHTTPSTSDLDDEIPF